jgi:hypothetical protein
MIENAITLASSKNPIAQFIGAFALIGLGLGALIVGLIVLASLSRT